MAEKQTGNPVFDYRAAFRTKAAAFQRVLMIGGVFLVILSGLMFAAAQMNDSLWLAAGVASVLGLLSCASGIAWGFHRRNRIRAEFRTLYGPQP